MSLIKYKILITAIEHGSITAAAEEMGYTQSGVSHMLNSLEDELGIKIISRNRNGVQLTSTGRLLYPYIKQVVNEDNSFMQAVSEITDILHGKLVIGTFTTVSGFYLPPMLEKFFKLYPNIEIEFREGAYEEVERWIETKEVDCGFVSLPTKDTLQYIPVLHDRLVIAVGKEYKHNFKDTNAVTVEELLKEKLVLIDGVSEDYDMIRLFSGYPERPEVKITTWNSTAAFSMIQHNIGIGIQPLLFIKAFAKDVDIFEFKEPFKRTLALAYLNKKEASPVTKKFIEFIAAQEIQDYNTDQRLKRELPEKTSQGQKKIVKKTP